KKLVKNKLNFFLCTAGIQYDKLKYNAMITKDQYLKKSLRGIASEFGMKYKHSTNKNLQHKETVWTKDLGNGYNNWTKQAYGTCQTLERDSEQPNTYKTEYEAIPFDPI
ncbi:MAG: hypothetical protein KDD45_12295, partial [Bdellovibrionales bacterium]|nr:hypothetical protein [Bdellovibrionales bacterium]